MFDNIGKKIKSVAKIFFVLGVILSVFYGITMLLIGLLEFDSFGYLIFIAPILSVLGCVLSWMSVIVLYGFGELVDTVCGEKQENINVIKKTVPKNPTANMVLCEICGADISSNKTVCHVCGNKIKKDIFKTVSSEKSDLCEKCGANISADVSNCHVCGNKIV